MNVRTNLKLAALMSIIAQSVHFRTQPKAMRSIEPRRLKQWDCGSGTGKRQGERVARQVARSFGDPFKASNECLARIKARLA